MKMREVSCDRARLAEMPPPVRSLYRGAFNPLGVVSEHKRRAIPASFAKHLDNRLARMREADIANVERLLDRGVIVEKSP